MSRPPRHDEPGSWHHVSNLGIARRDAFESGDDVRCFLGRVARAVRRGELELHAYSIRRRRFDLLVRSPRGRLSEGLRRIENEYVRRFNRARGRDGPLLVQRFRSQLVGSQLGRRMVWRRIHTLAEDEGDGRLEARGRVASSASPLARPVGPRWLERWWIEAVLREEGGGAPVLPRATAGMLEVVERRLAGQRGEPDPFDDLARDPEGELLRLLLARAQRGGKGALPLAVLDTGSVRKALTVQAARCGAWTAWRGGQPIDCWRQLHVALLRDLVGLAQAGAGQLAGCSQSGAGKHHARHRELLATDALYAERATRVAADAFVRCQDRFTTPPAGCGGQLLQPRVSGARCGESLLTPYRAEHDSERATVPAR